jgi:hypothetical protein
VLAKPTLSHAKSAIGVPSHERIRPPRGPSARARDGAPYDNDFAVVFRVADGRIDAVTEYCDTSHIKRVLFNG